MPPFLCLSSSAEGADSITSWLGLGYLYDEFKGLSQEAPFECKTSSLRTENGVVTVPTGPGSGIEIDPAFIRKHTVVKGSAGESGA